MRGRDVPDRVIIVGRGSSLRDGVGNLTEDLGREGRSKSSGLEVETGKEASESVTAGSNSCQWMPESIASRQRERMDSLRSGVEQSDLILHVQIPSPEPNLCKPLQRLDRQHRF